MFGHLMLHIDLHSQLNIVPNDNSEKQKKFINSNIN
jgi:hypothetical protein